MAWLQNQAKKGEQDEPCLSRSVGVALKVPWDQKDDPLEALRDGDPGPFEAFVRSETSTFLAFFRRLGARPAEAEDLTQETLLKMFRHASGYSHQGRFTAYAFRVARNAWIDRARRRGARPQEASGGTGEEDIRPDPISTREEEPGVALSRRDEANRLQGALAELGEPHRLVFELGVMQEMPYADIASMLEVPIGTVKSRMFHAVRKLRQVLGEPLDA
jgi:RNA polymerase sigma-70 factor, ECF subfamily